MVITAVDAKRFTGVIFWKHLMKVFLSSLWRSINRKIKNVTPILTEYRWKGVGGICMNELEPTALRERVDVFWCSTNWFRNQAISSQSETLLVNRDWWTGNSSVADDEVQSYWYPTWFRRRKCSSEHLLCLFELKQRLATFGCDAS